LLSVERFLQLCRRDVTAGFVEAAVVESVDVLQSGGLELFRRCALALLA